MRKTFIEAGGKTDREGGLIGGSLPLMRKTFIEAGRFTSPVACRVLGLFRLCGRLSLRHVGASHNTKATRLSLPLMRKTFIEAEDKWSLKLRGLESLPLMRKTFIEAIPHELQVHHHWLVSSAYAEDFH